MNCGSASQTFKSTRSRSENILQQLGASHFYGELVDCGTVIRLSSGDAADLCAACGFVCNCSSVSLFPPSCSPVSRVSAPPLPPLAMQAPLSRCGLFGAALYWGVGVFLIYAHVFNKCDMFSVLEVRPRQSARQHTTLTQS